MMALLKNFLNYFGPNLKSHFYDVFYTLIAFTQAIKNLIEKKKGTDKRLIQNWRPISMLNAYVKIISKALSKHLKNILPSLVSFNLLMLIRDSLVKV